MAGFLGTPSFWLEICLFLSQEKVQKWSGKSQDFDFKESRGYPDLRQLRLAIIQTRLVASCSFFLGWFLVSGIGSVLFL